jgi:Glyoxalase/Bleomycin resistance protein/Dioxygenase superfamily
MRRGMIAQSLAFVGRMHVAQRSTAVALSRVFCSAARRVPGPLSGGQCGGSARARSAVRAMASAQQAPLTLLSTMGKSLPDATWQQSMLRVKNPEASLKFYREVLGMTLVDEYHFPQWKFSLYFLQTLPVGAQALLVLRARVRAMN